MYKPLEVLGPEHEFSLVDETLKPLPIADKVIKAYCGRVANFIELPDFSFGKELQLHVMELKANTPFQSPVAFEETMQKGVETLGSFIGEKFGARLLGTGMHPLLKLQDTGIWPHYHRKIYDEFAKLFNLQQHGWLNIQSFHLNLPYRKEADGVLLHNLLANMCPYLPAVATSSPIYEGTLREKADNRLEFYKLNQQEVPSVNGDIVPEYATSLDAYKRDVIGGYSRDLAKAGASKTILNREWVNSRGVIFRFDRRALEIRVMDEQECIKSDVALSCYVRACLRGLLASEEQQLLPHEILVRDFNSVIADGLNAKVQNPLGATTQQVCRHFYDVAWANATDEEKRYLSLVQKRIEDGSLSDLIRRDVRKESERTSLREAIVKVYSRLIRCLATNQPYS